VQSRCVSARASALKPRGLPRGCGQLQVLQVSHVRARRTLGRELRPRLHISGGALLGEPTKPRSAPAYQAAVNRSGVDGSKSPAQTVAGSVCERCSRDARYVHSHIVLDLWGLPNNVCKHWYGWVEAGAGYRIPAEGLWSELRDRRFVERLRVHARNCALRVEPSAQAHMVWMAQSSVNRRRQKHNTAGALEDTLSINTRPKGYSQQGFHTQPPSTVPRCDEPLCQPLYNRLHASAPTMRPATLCA
jgi:hypothetical protein